jgi:hypothetical protein
LEQGGRLHWSTGSKSEQGRRSAGLLQRVDKGLYRDKTVPGIFGQRLEEHLFDFWWQAWYLLEQRGRRFGGMLYHDLDDSTDKGTAAREPLVDDHGERILITGRMGLAIGLLRGHIGHRATHAWIHCERVGAMGGSGNTKIAQ